MWGNTALKPLMSGLVLLLELVCCALCLLLAILMIWKCLNWVYEGDLLLNNIFRWWKNGSFEDTEIKSSHWHFTVMNKKYLWKKEFAIKTCKIQWWKLSESLVHTFNNLLGFFSCFYFKISAVSSSKSAKNLPRNVQSLIFTNNVYTDILMFHSCILDYDTANALQAFFAVAK